MNQTAFKMIPDAVTELRAARDEVSQIINKHNDALKLARMKESQAFERLTALISIAAKS